MANKRFHSWRDLLAILPIAMIIHIASTIPPIMLGRFVDANLKSGSIEWKTVVVILAVATVIFITEIWLNFLLASLSKKIITRGYLESMGRLFKKERLLFEKTKIGEMIDVFSRYISSLENTVTAFIANFSPAFIGTIAISAAIGYLVGPVLLIIILSMHGAIFGTTYFLSVRYGKKLKIYNKTCYELSDVWVELLGATKVIQNEFGFEYASERLSSSVMNLKDSQRASYHSVRRSLL